MRSYTCPVCGFNGLDEPPYDEYNIGSYDICPCCNFEFGYSEDHDVRLGYIVTPDHLIEAAFQLYRKQWIEAGMKIQTPENIPEELRNGDSLKPEVLLKQLKSLNLNLNNFDIDGFNE
ncbi:hypothetical protein HOO54_05030 [Bacillus sp. WMMC1349]|uniref:hypothetical protein n=1 Tax=Bacillus sp. WMMC1349 TaxID=2736254 RepID=UPI001557BDC6|nr:hypothetical protein [Bacillus sp. WMMC1349]NPC90765.1 hypothetical protein [Bacillus sp. WMMC1349]NPC91621.1 hypothetical protein [Bacillus sp. WMMC1349]